MKLVTNNKVTCCSLGVVSTAGTRQNWLGIYLIAICQNSKYIDSDLLFVFLVYKRFVCLAFFTTDQNSRLQVERNFCWPVGVADSRTVWFGGHFTNHTHHSRIFCWRCFELVVSLYFVVFPEIQDESICNFNLHIFVQNREYLLSRDWPYIFVSPIQNHWQVFVPTKSGISFISGLPLLFSRYKFVGNLFVHRRSTQIVRPSKIENILSLKSKYNTVNKFRATKNKNTLYFGVRLHYASSDTKTLSQDGREF